MRKRLRPASALRDHVLYRRLWPLRARPPAPRALCMLVTERCNLRCRACGIWKGGAGEDPELTAAEWDRLLADPLFRRVEFVNLNGGEPNLRPDLDALAAAALARFPRLRSLTFNTNGLPPGRAVENARALAGLCAPRGVEFSVAVSFHGVGDVFDAMSGAPGAYPKVLEALRGLRDLRDGGRLYLSANCVVTRLNLRRLDEVLAWGEAARVPVNFTLGEVRPRFRNLEAADDVRVGPEDRPALAGFFRSLSRRREFGHHGLRYAELADMVERGAPRRLACHYAMAGAILGPTGRLFYCKHGRDLGDARAGAAAVYYAPESLAYRSRELFASTCPACPPNTFIRMEAERDLPRLAAFLVRRRLRRR